MFHVPQIIEERDTARTEAALLRTAIAQLRAENAYLAARLRMHAPKTAPVRIHPPMLGLIPAGDDFPERM